MQSKKELRPGSLVLYKNQPGRINQIGAKKIEIALADNQTRSVRPKDVILLHPGPLKSLAELKSLVGEVEVSWELLAGSITTLAELAELAYGAYTPNSAWSAWQLISDGLLFSGTPNAVTVHPAETVDVIRAERAEKAAEEEAWQGFLDRAVNGQYDPVDNAYWLEVAALAWEQRSQNRVLAALGQAETAANGHALLLQIGFWDEMDNPYPRRAGLAIKAPEVSLPDLPEEDRLDLTHLYSLAIDDEGSQDPDDALSLDADGRLWVHIADAASLITPGSPADQAALDRAANLYLPEGTVPMLPCTVTEQLGLGLNDVSPALSFGLTFDKEGEIADLEIVLSWVKVTRLTYEAAEQQLNEEPYQSIYRLAQRYEEQRYLNGAVRIDLPEVKTQVIDGQVIIQPLPAFRSRDLVREAMLMTGEAVARYALRHKIPMPFTLQPPPRAEAELVTTKTPSQMFALRRTMQPSQQSTTPGPHAGLGMPLYVQATSPLRRYLDLVAHQQLRAFISGRDLMDESEIRLRISTAGVVSGSVRRAERLSNNHWALVYLNRQPDWQGEGIIIDKGHSHDLVLIPELGIETRVYGKKNPKLDQAVRLQLIGVNLPELEAHFHYLD